MAKSKSKSSPSASTAAPAASAPAAPAPNDVELLSDPEFIGRAIAELAGKLSVELTPEQVTVVARDEAVEGPALYVRRSDALVEHYTWRRALARDGGGLLEGTLYLVGSVHVDVDPPPPPGVRAAAGFRLFDPADPNR